MALLPSGIHYCINSKPLDELLHRAGNGSGLHIPDVRMIHGTDDLRRYMRLMWLLPLGADCATAPELNALSLPVPAHLTLVDSGYTFHRLPEHLDERDRQSLALFWQSPRCQAFLEQQMEKVRPVRRIALDHLEPEDSLISQWFPVPPPPPRSGPPLTQAEMTAKRNASRAELEAAVEEEMAEQAAISQTDNP
ncbi:MAG: hypothetical protein ACKVY0_19035 [Prosthecobacter sp.]|uniref:hypothetical protein n=1 Tax=Prosthecobacter sp. TaxID=1965333 RepID=UPI0039041DD2